MMGIRENLYRVYVAALYESRRASDVARWRARFLTDAELQKAIIEVSERQLKEATDRARRARQAREADEV